MPNPASRRCVSIGAVSVSEPGAAGMLLLAMAGLFAMRHRRTWVPEHYRARPG